MKGFIRQGSLSSLEKNLSDRKIRRRCNIIKVQAEKSLSLRLELHFNTNPGVTNFSSPQIGYCNEILHIWFKCALTSLITERDSLHKTEKSCI